MKRNFGKVNIATFVQSPKITLEVKKLEEWKFQVVPTISSPKKQYYSKFRL
jgi:hypothetical protein